MAAKNTKKKTKMPLKKSTLKRVHGGTSDGSSGIDSASSIGGVVTLPPVLTGKAIGSTGGSEVSPFGSSGISSRR